MKEQLFEREYEIRRVNDDFHRKTEEIRKDYFNEIKRLQNIIDDQAITIDNAESKYYPKNQNDKYLLKIQNLSEVI